MNIMCVCVCVCMHTIGKLLFLGFKCRGKVEGVENATRVTTLMRGQAVLLEDRVLVHTTRVLDVLPPSDLHIVEQNELDNEQGRGRCEVFGFTGIIPLRSVNYPNLSENFGQKHPCNTQHSPTSIHELSLYIPS